MFSARKIIAIVFLTQKLCEPAEWTPIKPPFQFWTQSQDLQIMKPPEVGRVYWKTPRRAVDLEKPKSQTFYKATLAASEPFVYQFQYKVHHPKEENYQEKAETRTVDSVQGNYSVREPNGYVIVKYKSDLNGFQKRVSHHRTDDNEGGRLFTMTRHVT